MNILIAIPVRCLVTHDLICFLRPLCVVFVVTGGHSADAAAVERGAYPRTGETRGRYDAKGFEVRQSRPKRGRGGRGGLSVESNSVKIFRDAVCSLLTVFAVK